MSGEASGNDDMAGAGDPTVMDFAASNFGEGVIGRAKCGSAEGEVDRNTGAGLGEGEVGRKTGVGI
jgi:hypothetical protein